MELLFESINKAPRDCEILGYSPEAGWNIYTWDADLHPAKKPRPYWAIKHSTRPSYDRHAQPIVYAVLSMEPPK